MNIGNVTVERGILLAPMEDVTDLPFRLICKRLGADIVYTEFISSDGLVRDARRSLEKLILAEEERPVAIQIFGGELPVMIDAALRAEAAGPDFLDINCGCWVKNVVARNAGAALLKDPPQMAAIAKAIVDNCKLPVTLKTRLGWDNASIRIVEVAQRLEQTGIKALAIHCRTRDMGHGGSADWSWIEKVKAAISIPVILNGDVTSPEDVKRAFDDTGCDAVMIGRAAITNPFIFRQAKTYLDHGIHEEPPSRQERIDTCLEHLRLSVEFKGPRHGILEFRKYYAGYLRGLYHASTVRQDLVRYESVAQIEERLHVYNDFLCDYENMDVPGDITVDAEAA
jgi:tRNA-dihydrouridine synthase B